MFLSRDQAGRRQGRLSELSAAFHRRRMHSANTKEKQDLTRASTFSGLIR